MTLTLTDAFTGSIDHQRAYRRRRVLAQAIAIEMIEGADAAARFEAEALQKLAIVSHCDVCRLELIGDDECPRCGFPESPDFDTDSEGDEA